MTLSVSSNHSIPPQPLKIEEDIDSTSSLNCFSIHSIHKQFIEKYDPEIVQQVFSQLKKRYSREVPKLEIERADVFCLFFDLEKKATQSLHFEEKAKSRILKRYRLHMKHEISKLINSHNELVIKKEDAIKAIEYYTTFAQMIPFLLDKYGESILKRALDHFSILPSKTLSGQEELSSCENFCERIDLVFQKEQQVTALLEVMPYEALSQKYDLLYKIIQDIKDPYGKFDLERELSLKCGKIKNLIPKFNKVDIEAQSKLFSISLDATMWAENIEDLTPIDSKIHHNINTVFFLKSSREIGSDKNIAVFKCDPMGGTESGAMEALAYDVSLLFGVSSGIVPTKQKNLRGMAGSIQLFQDGLSWTQLAKKSKAERKEIISNISMRSFLEGLLPILVLGNRDVHPENFFIVKKNKAVDDDEISSDEKAKAKDEYGIVVFDNGLSFQYSNFILTSIAKMKASEIQNIFTTTLLEEKRKKNKNVAQENIKKQPQSTPSSFISPQEKNTALKRNHYSLPPIKLSTEPIKKTSSKDEDEEVYVRESLLPIRCAILALPHADTIIKGRDLEWLKQLVSTWPKSFDAFFAYYNSATGMAKVKNLHRKRLSHSQLKAFNDRLQKIINLVDSGKPFTPRDLVISLYPLYHDFYALSQMLYPDYPDFALGAKTAEYLCKKAVHRGIITQEKADLFLNRVYECVHK